MVQNASKMALEDLVLNCPMVKLVGTLSNILSKGYASNIVDLTWPERGERVSGTGSDQFETLSLSSGNDGWRTREARRDFYDAKRLVGERIQIRAADPEGWLLLANSLDGKSPGERSVSQEAGITAILSDICSDRPNSDPFGGTDFEFPDVQIASVGSAFEILNANGTPMLPDGVSAAVVSGGISAPDGILIDKALGFREMHIAARHVYGIIFGREAKVRGLETVEGHIGQRFAMALDGEASDFSSAGDEKPDAVISVSFGNQMFNVAPNDYVDPSILEE